MEYQIKPDHETASATGRIDQRDIIANKDDAQADRVKKAIRDLIDQGYDEEDAEWFVMGMLAWEQDED